jgi:hypothetical protein
MQNLLTRLIYLVVTAQLMVACSALQTIAPTTEQASLQNQRAANAELALQQLEEIDTLIRLDNNWLSDQIIAELNSQAATSGQYSFRKLNLYFVRQTIALDASVDISDQQGNVISASVSGEILLDFSGAHLEWLPRFSQLLISSKNFTFGDGSYVEPIPELTQDTIRNLNINIADALIEQGGNIIPLSAVPLGEVQVGASLPGFSTSPAMKSEALRGLFMVAGSAMLIDSSITSIALDMAFIPDLSTCPADVTVSRAAFTSGINAREPVDIVRYLGGTTDTRYFFSEIAGAKRQLTIIHYWFADGLPVTAEELSVGPSERWRTWSASRRASSNAHRLEVLVVEKESGCILLSKTIRTPEMEITITPTDPTKAKQTFMALSDNFNRRTADFSITGGKPAIARIEVRRSFFRDVLQASLADLNMDADFDSSALSALQFQAELQAFDVENIICDQRDCPPAPVCTAVLTQCKRLRDTRECASCQFRNPLNNRCVSEAIDPLCEASRERQNAKYEAERANCIAEAETAKRECEQLASQATESCQIESGFEGSTCESIRTGLESLKPGTSLATVSAQTRSAGKLSVNFSTFMIEGDLEGLKLDMALKSDLQMDGKLKFSPTGAAPLLSNCIASWNAPFSNRFVTTPEANKLLTNLEESGSALTANWSGFGLNISTNPSPLESMFVGNPQLLANCNIGLTVNKVEQAVSGDNAKFFTGNIELEFQPLPTVIKLSPATVEFGDRVHSAEAILSQQFVRYDIEK